MRRISPKSSLFDQSLYFSRLIRILPRRWNTEEKFDFFRIPSWMRSSEESVNMGINEAHVVFKVSLCLFRGRVAGKWIPEVWIKVQFESIFDLDIIAFLIAEEPPAHCVSRTIVSNLSPDFVGELLTRNSIRPGLYTIRLCPIIPLREGNSCRVPVNCFESVQLLQSDIPVHDIPKSTPITIVGFQFAEGMVVQVSLFEMKLRTQRLLNFHRRGCHADSYVCASLTDEGMIET